MASELPTAEEMQGLIEANENAIFHRHHETVYVKLIRALVLLAREAVPVHQDEEVSGVSPLTFGPFPIEGWAAVRLPGEVDDGE